MDVEVGARALEGDEARELEEHITLGVGEDPLLDLVAALVTGVDQQIGGEPATG
jgi:hypothetical protein